MPVNHYNGGNEHNTRHLIYSRFWHKALYDLGFVNTVEPYKKRTTNGLLMGSDGKKMFVAGAVGYECELVGRCAGRGAKIPETCGKYGGQIDGRADGCGI